MIPTSKITFHLSLKTFENSSSIQVLLVYFWVWQKDIKLGGSNPSSKDWWSKLGNCFSVKNWVTLLFDMGDLSKWIYFQSVSRIEDMNVSPYIIWPSWKAFKMVILFSNCIWSGKRAIHIHVIIYHKLIHFWFPKIIYIFLQQFTHWISEKECKIQQNILNDELIVEEILDSDWYQMCLLICNGFMLVFH